MNICRLEIVVSKYDMNEMQDFSVGVADLKVLEPNDTKTEIGTRAPMLSDLKTIIFTRFL